MAQALIRFPGITQTKGGYVTISRGPFPSKALIYFVPQSSLSLSTGDLTITYDAATVTLPDAEPQQATLRQHKTSKGYLWSIVIVDRRQRWQDTMLTGRWNFKDCDGSRRNEQNFQQLATTLLNAMGESGADVSVLPTTIYPELDLKGANPAMELDRLCDEAGCEIAVNGSTTTIVQRGTGSALSGFTTRQITPSFTFTPSGGPTYFQVQGGKTIVDGLIKLEAVGMESDGTIEPIANLSYAPASWAKEHPLIFSGVALASRDLAFHSIYRMYRIKSMIDDTLDIPGVGTINYAEQIHLRDKRASVDIDGFPRPPRVYGIYHPDTEAYVNTGSCAHYNGNFRIDVDNGLVIFDEPVYKFASVSGAGCYLPADLTLHTSYEVDDNPGQRYRYQATVDSAGATATAVAGETKSIYKPELWELVTHQYSNCENYADPNHTTNKSTIDTEAAAWLSLMRAPYNASRSQRTLSYEGVIPTTLGGVISQVSYDLGGLKDGLAKTTASENFEHDTTEPSAASRRTRRQALC